MVAAAVVVVVLVPWPDDTCSHQRSATSPYPNLVSGAPRKHLPSLLDLVSFSFHSTELSKSASNHIKLGNARQRFVSNSSKAKGTCQNSISSQITGHRISLHPPSAQLHHPPPSLAARSLISRGSRAMRALIASQRRVLGRRR